LDPKYPNIVTVAGPAPGAVHDDVGALDGRLDPLAGAEITCDVLDPVLGRTTVPAEYADTDLGVAQSRDDQSAQGARAAGDQDGCRHGSRSSFCRPGSHPCGAPGQPSVSLALLVVLETLTPAERLAFVLHDMFDLRSRRSLPWSSGP
jgi:hypothetical protein